MSSHMAQAPQKPQQNKSPLVPVLIGLVVAILGIGGILFAGGFFAPKVPVPDLTWFDQEGATKQLASVGLKLGEVSEDATADLGVGGIVVSQTPAAGTNAVKDSAVNIVVSTGPKLTDPVVVPDLKGMTAEEAEQALIGVLLIGQPGEAVYNTEVEPGKVCQQSVPAGTQIMPLEIVTYQVSIGEEKIAVPDVVGKPVAEARDELSKAGLSIDTTQVYKDDVEKDKVVSQSIAKGEQVSRGTTVTLEVSLGARPAAKVAVPNVLTYDLESAKRTLESAGLAYKLTGDDDGTIVSVRPNPGAQVEQGTTVELQVKRPQPAPVISRDDAMAKATSLVNEIKGYGDTVHAENVVCSNLYEEGGARYYVVEFDMGGAFYKVQINAETNTTMDIIERNADGSIHHYDATGAMISSE